MEGACECSVTEEAPGARAALVVSSCMFHEVLVAEGKPQLLANLCCQHNATWLDAYDAAAVRSALTQCMARGDAACRIEVEAPAGGGAGSRKG
jgi:hypothetical protein